MSTREQAEASSHRIARYRTMTPRGKDAVIAVAEAAMNAGLDVDTIALGMGYSNKRNFIQAIRLMGEDHKQFMTHARDDTTWREVVEMYYDLHMTAEHICEVTGKTPGSLEATFRRKSQGSPDKRYLQLKRLFGALDARNRRESR